MPGRWTPATVLRRAREVLHTEGAATLLWKVLGETLFRRMRWHETPLVPPPRVRAAEPDLEFGFVEPDGIDDYLALRPDLTRAEVERRLALGHRCYVVRRDGEVLSGRWIATREVRIDYLDRVVSLRPGDVYLYETYTAPAHRGRGLSAAAGTRLAGLLAAEGYDCIVGAVVPENRTAFRAFRKTGYRDVGSIGYVRLGRWRRDWARIRR